MEQWYDPRYITYRHPDDVDNVDGLNRAEFEAQRNGQEPPPIPDPKPLPPMVTRLIVAVFAALAGTCAWFTDSWIRNTGIAFAVLFFCLAILPARRRRRR